MMTDMAEKADQAVTQPGSTHPRIIDTESARAKGYDMPHPVPVPVVCRYCGKRLFHYGLLSPFGDKKVIVWRDRPERCTCGQAVAFWEKYDAEEKARKEREEEEKARLEEMRRFESLIRLSGIKGRFQCRLFENYVRDTEGREKAYQQAKKYADNFPMMLPGKDAFGKAMPPAVLRNGLFIAGSYGTGKTHLAAAIANQLLRGNTAVVCMTMIDMLGRIRETWNENRKYRDEYGGTDDESSILAKYQDVPLLIIDDIGSEQPTEWGISKIFAIINARYEAYMPVVVTTNYSGEELVKRMTPPGGDDRNARKTLDRLMETCVGIDMTWESWRAK